MFQSSDGSKQQFADFGWSSERLISLSEGVNGLETQFLS